ncbi:MAG: collagen-like protein [Saprospiraceae bacterium]|nr:collagen-like protein [Saprospiraceae bacterium]
MKKFLLSAFLVTICAFLAHAQQTPPRFNYQAAVRNASGAPIVNQLVSLQISINDGSPNGQSQYTERHILSTNDFGLVNLQIGAGQVQSGSFSNITWGGASKWLKIDIDPNAGTNFSPLGASEMVSVPYALYAQNAGNNSSTLDQLSDVNTSGVQTGQVLQWNGSAWVAATAVGQQGPQGPAGPQGATGPQGPTGLQGATGPQGPAGPQGATGPQGPAGTYTPGNGISINNGVISNTGDLDGDNEIQQLSISGSQITLSNGGGTIQLPPNSGTDSQTLSINGNNLSISNGNSVTLPAGPQGPTGPQGPQGPAGPPGSYTAGSGISINNGVISNTGDGDNSASNEIQQLSLSGNQINLSNGGGTITLPTAPTYTAGPGISINGSNVISNTGDNNPSDDITNSTSAGGDLSGFYPTPQIAPNAVNSAKIADGSIVAADLAPGTVPRLINDLDDVNTGGVSNNQVLKWNGSAWLPAADNNTQYTAGSGININGTEISAVDASSNNELQTLSLSGQQLSISNGNSVNLPADGDGSATNEIQTLSLSGQQLSLSNGGGSVTLPTGNNLFTANGNNIYNNNAGSVGIGTDSPIAKLQVSNNSTSLDAIGVFGGDHAYALHLDPNEATAAVGIHPIGFETKGLEIATVNGTAIESSTGNGIGLDISNSSIYFTTPTVRINNYGTARTPGLQIETHNFQNEDPIIRARHRAGIAALQLTSHVNSPSKIILDNDNGFEPGWWELEADGQNNLMLFSHYRLNTGGGITSKFPLSLTPNYMGVNESEPQHRVDVDGIVRAQVGFESSMWGLLWDAVITRNTLGAGHVDLQNPAGFGSNVRLTTVASSANKGAMAVYSSGTLKAQVYVDGSNNGVVFANIKNFRMDHPKDPQKEIWYACIEGPEAAAYERGTARLENGMAHIRFSEHFENVINPQSMTVMLTPMSADSKGLAVIEKTPEGFVVKEMFQGDGNYQFDGEVKAVRKGYENYQPVRDKKDVEAILPAQLEARRED